MKRTLIVLASLVLSAGAWAAGHEGAAADVLQLVQQHWDARNDNDYKTQRDLMTDGVHFNANSNGQFFYDEEKPSLDDLAENLSGDYDVSVMHPTAEQLSDTVVLARYYLEGTITVDEGTISNYRTRVTHIWIKEGGKWKSKSWHFSPLHNGGTVPN